MIDKCLLGKQMECDVGGPVLCITAAEGEIVSGTTSEQRLTVW